MKIGIILDSFCGKDKKELLKMNYNYLPLRIFFDEKEYFDGVDISKEKTMKLIGSSPKIKTSQPSTGAMLKLFEETSKKYDYVFYFCIASALSSTYNSAIVVGKEFKNLTIFNTATCGLALFPLIKKSLEMYDKTSNIEKTKKFINSKLNQTITYVIPKDVTNLEKGGRIKKSSRVILNKLQIIPILKFTTEELKVKTIRRTQKKAIIKAIGLLEKSIANIKKPSFGIIYAGEMKIVNFTVALIKKTFNVIPKYELASSIIMGHTGLGAIGVYVFSNLN